MRTGVCLVVGLILTAITFLAVPSRASFDASFTDPAGDTVTFQDPSQAMIDAADVISGQSAADPTTITLTITTRGPILVPGATSTYTLEAHGEDALVLVWFNGTTGACDLCSYAYNYMSTGGGSGSALVTPVISGGTSFSVGVPIAWGGDSATYLLTFTSLVFISFGGGPIASDMGGQVNEAPSITNGPGPSVTVPVGTPYSYAFMATDPENDEVTWSVSANPTATWLTIATGGTNGNTGTLTGTPPVQGTWGVEVEVRDAFGGTDVYPFELTAGSCAGNARPGITNPVTSAQTVAVGAVYSYNFEATDPTSDPLSWSLTGSNPSWGSIASDTGVFNAVPVAAGDYTFTIQVTDGCTPVTTTVTLHVTQPGGGAGVDPRTNTQGRSSALTITVTRNQVSWSRTEDQVTIDWQVEGTTTGTVDHLEYVLIAEYRNRGPDMSPAIPELPDVTFGGRTSGFHGTGTGGSRATWHNHIFGTFSADPEEPDVSDPNVRRVVACYIAYADVAETQWNFACVVVFGEGAGNTGSGDQTAGPGQAAGLPLGLPVILLIIVIIVVVGVLAFVLMRRRMPQPPAQPPLPPPSAPPPPAPPPP